MSDGTILKIGSPEDVYNEPHNIFVAELIGESNIFDGKMTGQLKVLFCGAEFECLDDYERDRAVDVVIRPEDVMIVPPGQGQLSGVIQSIVFKGVHYETTVLSGQNEMVIHNIKTGTVGETIGMYIEPDGIHCMPRKNGD
jgi:spermidine/putrescine transport system ATP-binding protein